MFKKIKKNHRKSKNFHSGFIAAVIVSYFLGIFISIMSNQNSLPVWSPYILNWIIMLLVLSLVLKGAYAFLVDKTDKKSRESFYDNFFMGLVVVIVVTPLVMYHSLFEWWMWVLFTIILIPFYFICNVLYLLFYPKK
jgi:high-affinity Fe2+/Pb2+ permease